MSLRLVYVLYCIEAGFFFIMVPWTRFWLSNPLLNFTASVHFLATNPYFRGFVSGFGVVHVVLGVRELVELIESRRQTRLNR